MKRKPIIIGAIAVLGAAGAFAVQRNGTGPSGAGSLPEFEAKRGNLAIEVLEGGNIRAIESHEIKNDVRVSAGTKILDIIEEGYQVSAQDVEEGRVLVQLDPSGIEEAIVDHDVEFQQTEASYAETRQGLDIEESESLSGVKMVRQTLRFALLDFQKFLGEKAAREILQSLSLPYDTDTIAAYEGEATEEILKGFDTGVLLAEEAEKGDAATESNLFSGNGGEDSRAAGVDFAVFLEADRLGEGEAEQTIRRLKDEALVAKTELAVVEESVAGARRLHEREFITRQTLDNEMVGLEKARLSLQTKETELSLFLDYEFPKEAEKMLSYYEESLLNLLREKRQAMAKVARAQAKYRSARRRYELELKKREDLDTQLASCTIVAQVPGLVSYGGSNDGFYSRTYDAISKGAALKFGQPIIIIPDMSQLGVDLAIHESHVQKLQTGQRAVITADAVPGMTLEGRVTKVAVLPDSNASRYNPSLKVYPTTVEITGNDDLLKPGMTAKVRVIVEELSDVLFVPVQAIFVEEDQRFVFVREGSRYRRQAVSTGSYNDEFIEIAAGLLEGDRVALRSPDGYDPKSAGEALVPPDMAEAREPAKPAKPGGGA